MAAGITVVSFILGGDAIVVFSLRPLALSPRECLTDVIRLRMKISVYCKLVGAHRLSIESLTTETNRLTGPNIQSPLGFAPISQHCGQFNFYLKRRAINAPQASMSCDMLWSELRITASRAANNNKTTVVISFLVISPSSRTNLVVVDYLPTLWRRFSFR